MNTDIFTAQIKAEDIHLNIAKDKGKKKSDWINNKVYCIENKNIQLIVLKIKKSKDTKQKSV